MLRKVVNQAVMAVMTAWEDGVMDSLINVAAHGHIEIRPFTNRLCHIDTWDSRGILPTKGTKPLAALV